MNESQIILQSLIAGAVNATILVVTASLLSRFVSEAAGRGLLALLLLVAAGAYVEFAVRANAAPMWVAIEVAQLFAFGVLATVGWRRSPYWLAAGWALHPFWDVPLHYAGPGHSFTPVVYAISCVSFDWLVAGYIVITHRWQERAHAATIGGEMASR